jgi:hypothetical protein
MDFKREFEAKLAKYQHDYAIRGIITANKQVYPLGSDTIRPALITKICNQIAWVSKQMRGKDWTFVVGDWSATLDSVTPDETFLGLFAPATFAPGIAADDHAYELVRNAGLADAPPERQAEHRVTATRHAEARLRRMRRVLIVSALSMASAVAVALAVRAVTSMPEPRERAMLAVASVFAFAWATLGRLGWAGQSIAGDTAVERLDATLFHALYWCGMALGAAAAL